jgi:hypothetical protein
MPNYCINPMKPIKVLASLLASAGFAGAATMWGVTDTNQLVSFNSSAPGSLLSSATITGMVASDGTTPDPLATIVNLTFNPATGQFIGIDSNANIYTVNATGSTTLINNSFSPAGFDAGLSYDPFTGGFVYADDAAARFNITNAGIASLVGTAAYAAGDVNQATAPEIFGVAIDPDFGSAFFLDANLGILALALDPNAAELFTVGSLGFAVTSYGDLTIDADGNLFASLSTNGLDSGFYSVNPNTGAATLIGNFASGMSTITIPEPSAALLGAIGSLALLRRRRA